MPEPRQSDLIDEESAVRLIKRYANRKLYDTRESRYVTLQQIGEYVRAGEEVRIIDNTSKEDLTSATLAQVVYEHEKSGGAAGGAAGGVVATKLRDMIQRSGERIITSLRDGPVGKLVPQSVRPEDGGEAARRAPLSRLVEQSKEALEEVQRLADGRMRGVVSAAIHQVHQLHGEVGRLQARIEELEAKLVRLQERRSRTGTSEPPPEDGSQQ